MRLTRLGAVHGRLAREFFDQQKGEAERGVKIHGLAVQLDAVGQPDGRGFVELGEFAAREEKNPFAEAEGKNGGSGEEKGAGDSGVEEGVELEAAGEFLVGGKETEARISAEDFLESGGHRDGEE